MVTSCNINIGGKNHHKGKEIYITVLANEFVYFFSVESVGGMNYKISNKGSFIIIFALT